MAVSLDRTIVTAYRLESLVNKSATLNESVEKGFLPLTLRDKYLNEKSRGEVVYFSPSEAREYRIIIREGRLYEADGRTPIDTVKARSRHTGLGVMPITLDLKGRLYGSNNTYVERGEVHHPSYVNGDDAAFAGELRVINGYVTAVTDKSGHYHPRFAHTAQFIAWLKRQGVDLTQVRFLMVEGHGLNGDDN